MMPPSRDELTRWLVTCVAGLVERPAAEIDPHAPLADHGLDSLYAFTLWGRIEDTYSIEMDPALLGELLTISALADHVSAVCAAA